MPPRNSRNVPQPQSATQRQASGRAMFDNMKRARGFFSNGDAVCGGPIAASGAVSSGEQYRFLLPSYQLEALRADAPIGRRRGRAGRLRRGR